MTTDILYPGLKLKKKHLPIAYHKVRANIDKGGILVLHESRETNVAYILTQNVPPKKQKSFTYGIFG